MLNQFGMGAFPFITVVNFLRLASYALDSPRVKVFQWEKLIGAGLQIIHKLSFEILGL